MGACEDIEAIKQADFIINNYRPGVAERLGIALERAGADAEDGKGLVELELYGGIKGSGVAADRDLLDEQSARTKNQPSNSGFT